MAAQAITAVLRDEPRKRAQEAVRSGRPLTDAERANAAPQVRDRLDARDRRAAAKRIMLDRQPGRQQQHTRDRGGGGRNR